MGARAGGFLSALVRSTNEVYMRPIVVRLDFDDADLLGVAVEGPSPASVTTTEPYDDLSSLSNVSTDSFVSCCSSMAMVEST